MSIGNFLMGNKDAKNAANAQRYAADQSTALNREQLDYIKQIMAPYQQAGQTALPALQGFINQPADQFNFSYDSYFKSPQYQALMGQQNEQALRTGAATGGIRGGDTQAALATIAPQLAMQAEDAARQNFSLNQGARLNQYNMLQGLAGLGVGASNQVGNAAQTFGQVAGNNALNVGNAMANKYQQYGQNRQGLLSDMMTGLFKFGGGF